MRKNFAAIRRIRINRLADRRTGGGGVETLGWEGVRRTEERTR